MVRQDNYAVSAAEARKLFANYDHQILAKKLRAKMDDDYFYTVMFGEQYRIQRITGDISRLCAGEWIEANSFNETLTLLDLVCDSKDGHYPTGRWKNMTDFGLQFHSTLMESRPDSNAEFFQDHAEAFASACRAFGGREYHLGDVAYSIEIFDGLCILVQLWFGDEEFSPQLRWLWDENAMMYLKYETMYYAIGLLLSRIKEYMKSIIE